MSASDDCPALGGVCTCRICSQERSLCHSHNMISLYLLEFKLYTHDHSRRPHKNSRKQWAKVISCKCKSFVDFLFPSDCPITSHMGCDHSAARSTLPTDASTHPRSSLSRRIVAHRISFPEAKRGVPGSFLGQRSLGETSLSLHLLTVLPFQ